MQLPFRTCVKMSFPVVSHLGLAVRCSLVWLQIRERQTEEYETTVLVTEPGVLHGSFDSHCRLITTPRRLVTCQSRTTTLRPAQHMLDGYLLPLGQHCSHQLVLNHRWSSQDGENTCRMSVKDDKAVLRKLLLDG